MKITKLFMGVAVVGIVGIGVGSATAIHQKQSDNHAAAMKQADDAKAMKAKAEEDAAMKAKSTATPTGDAMMHDDAMTKTEQ